MAYQTLPDLDAMIGAQLVAFCKEKGIKGYSNKRVEELRAYVKEQVAISGNSSTAATASPQQASKATASAGKPSASNSKPAAGRRQSKGNMTSSDGGTPATAEHNGSKAHSKGSTTGTGSRKNGSKEGSDGADAKQLRANKRSTGSKSPSTAAEAKQQKPHAELFEAEDIAQGFAGTRNRAIDVVVKGEMAKTPSELRAHLRDVFGEHSGNYLFCVRPPSGKKWLPIYLGKAEKLAERIGSAYIQSNGTFGPAKEQKKHWRLLEMQSRGFSMQIRWRIGLLDAKASETAQLEKYDFALNSSENGGSSGIRDVELPSGKAVKDFPVVNEDMDVLCAAVRYQCTYTSEE